MKTADLTAGKKQSCGCLQRERRAAGNPTHGRSKTSEYTAWLNMRARCYDPRNTLYHRYGGRGVTVCERWRASFEAFFEDVGPKPSPKHMLERRDNDGHYEPANCYWATRAIQSRNTSAVVYILYKGQRMALLDAIEKYRPTASYRCILARLARGWDAVRAFESPPDPKRHKRWAAWRKWKTSNAYPAILAPPAND